MQGWRSGGGGGQACAQAALWSHSRRPQRSDVCLLVPWFLWKSGLFVVDGTSKGTWPSFTALDLQPLRSLDLGLEVAAVRQVPVRPPGYPRPPRLLCFLLGLEVLSPVERWSTLLFLPDGVFWLQIGFSACFPLRPCCVQGHCWETEPTHTRMQVFPQVLVAPLQVVGWSRFA